MVIDLKKTKTKEIEGLAKIYCEEMSKPPYNESWTVKKAKEKMNFFKKYFDFYTIFTDSQIAGFVVVNPKALCPGEVAFGEEFVIKGNMQRKGIGTEVVSKLLQIYKERKFKSFMAIVEPSSGSFNIFKKLGIGPSKQFSLIQGDLI